MSITIGHFNGSYSDNCKLMSATCSSVDIKTSITVLSGRKCRCDENGTAFRLPRAAHPNAKLNANCSSELQTMNCAKGHLFARHRVGYNFRALVDRTVREQRREDR